MKRKGFTLGRFQPFHNEHAKLIERMKSECDEVYVGILNTKFSEYNPCTYDEREEMISGYDSSLNVFEYDRKDVVTLGIGIRLEVPFGAVFYSGDKKECAGMAALGFVVDYKKRGTGSATSVRKKLFSGNEEWKE
ncbi:MAG: adenylyltransferase/cytidyltransferase family protein, partial [Candidatus Aenigmarchaeota archaeon]|nr:adenylyltransferase/cytidyltransferase family protein [Candidatus Aenigmarchaeota archaeon]